MSLTRVPHKLLSSPCALVDAKDLASGKHDTLIAEMKELMLKHKGIGLAGNQAGQDLSLFVIDEAIAEEYQVPSVFANPEITDYSRDTEPVEEGCLSIPGFWTPIRRSKKIMFKGLDCTGKKIKFRARGLLARVLQHETDHLNGLTIKDRSE